MGVRTLTVILAAMIAAACGNEAPAQAPEPAAASDAAPAALTDQFVGNPDASVVLVEYGAPTCPACKSWHDTFWGQLKTEYVDTNKIKFVFRVLPSHNPPIDAAIASIGRCAGPGNFFPVLDDAFEKQMEIERAAQTGKALEALQDLASSYKLSGADVEACIKNEANVQRVYDVQDMASAENIRGTPSFVLNGTILPDGRYAAIKAAIDAELAKTE